MPFLTPKNKAKAIPKPDINSMLGEVINEKRVLFRLSLKRFLNFLMKFSICFFPSYRLLFQLEIGNFR